MERRERLWEKERFQRGVGVASFIIGVLGMGSAVGDLYVLGEQNRSNIENAKSAFHSFLSTEETREFLYKASHIRSELNGLVRQGYLKEAKDMVTQPDIAEAIAMSELIKIEDGHEYNIRNSFYSEDKGRKKLLAQMSALFFGACTTMVSISFIGAVWRRKKE